MTFALGVVLLSAAVLLTGWMARRRAERRRIAGRYAPAQDRRRPGDGVAGKDAGPADGGLYTALMGEMRGVAGALDRQSRQLDALRVDFRDRLRAIETQLGEKRAPAPSLPPGTGIGAEDPPAALPQRSPGLEADGWLTAVETHAVAPLSPAPSPAAAHASGLPVEVRDGMLVISHSLPPAAYVVPEGPGRARLLLNDQVEINEYALPKWEAFFELRGARPYATYRTLRAAEVSWDAAVERGAPLTPGLAEAV